MRLAIQLTPVVRIGSSLIAEHYDIPTRAALEPEPSRIDLALQEDVCSLLCLTRNDKYRTSVERIADSLNAHSAPAASPIC